MQCVLCTVYCVLCTVYCVLCTVYCVLCTVYCVLCTVYCVLCTVYCVLCTVYCVLCTVYCGTLAVGTAVEMFVAGGVDYPLLFKMIHCLAKLSIFPEHANFTYRENLELVKEYMKGLAMRFRDTEYILKQFTH